MKTPCKIVSFDTRKEMHEPLLNLYGQHNVGIDFVRDMTEAIYRIKDIEYTTMFIYTNSHESLDSIRAVRSLTHMPIIVVSDQYNGDLKMHSLSIGADDYFPEPENLEEGMASFFAQMRGRQEYSKEADASNVILTELVLLDANQYKVFVLSDEVELAHKEFLLLQTLMDNPQKALTYDALYDHINPTSANVGNTKNIIQQLMNRLHKKIEEPKMLEIIRAIPGVGYAFDPKKKPFLK